MMHDGHVKISRVLELRASQLEVSREILIGVICLPLIDDLPFDHKKKVVEECVYLRVGLMNGKEDSLACPCQISEFVDDDEGGQ